MRNTCRDQKSGHLDQRDYGKWSCWGTESKAGVCMDVTLSLYKSTSVSFPSSLRTLSLWVLTDYDVGKSNFSKIECRKKYSDLILLTKVKLHQINLSTVQKIILHIRLPSASEVGLWLY